MVKIGILFPFKEIEEIGRPLVVERKLDVVYMKTTSVSDVVIEARKAIEAGAEIVISRGYQAQILKKYTNVPLVEMRIQFQEVGMLIKRAKELIPKENLKIGLIC